jgi:serine/threonine protein kinase
MRSCPKCKKPTNDVICPHDGAPTHIAHNVDIIGSGASAIDPLAARYELLKQTSADAAGLVYTGKRIDTGEKVSVRLFDPRISADPIFRRAVGLQIKRAKSCSSPVLVRPIDSGMTRSGRAYIVSDPTPGRPLLEAIANGQFRAWIRVRELMLQILDGVGAAHKRGLVFRDLQPASVWIEAMSGGAERIRVSDMVVPWWESGAESLQEEGTPGFAPSGYSAPERILKGVIDTRGDMYSLGALLYHVLTERPPIKGDVATIVRALHAGQHPVLSQEAVGFWVPRRAVDLIRYLLARDPVGRPWESEEVVRWLITLPLSQDEEGSRSQLGLYDRVEVDEEGRVNLEPPGSQVSIEIQRISTMELKRYAAFGGVGILVVAIILGLITLFSDGDVKQVSRQPPTPKVESTMEQGRTKPAQDGKRPWAWWKHQDTSSPPSLLSPQE